MVIEHPHRRFNALTGEWVLVSSGRTGRPWQGTTEESATVARPPYDPECYLCPGNARAGGETNPDYDATYTFTNDFAALRPDVPMTRSRDGLLVAETEGRKEWARQRLVMAAARRSGMSIPPSSVDSIAEEQLAKEMKSNLETTGEDLDRDSYLRARNLTWSEYRQQIKGLIVAEF